MLHPRWLRSATWTVTAAIVALALSCGGSPVVTRPADVGEPPAGVIGAEVRRYVITIASDDYDFDGFRPLDRAEKDADAVEGAFIDRLGFESRADLRLRGDAATTDNIRHLFGNEGPLKGLPREAMVVIYIALHGRTQDCTAPDAKHEEARRMCGQLVTRDAQRGSQTIELTAILDLINKYAPSHSIVLIDVCKGGLALGAPIAPLDYSTLFHPRPEGAPASEPRRPRRSSERRSRKVLTSAGPTEDADDGGPARPGVFAEALLHGLDGAADLYADGWLLFPELAVWLHAEVHRRSGGAQEPEYDGFHDDGRGVPVLGALRLVGGSAADSGALLGEAREQVDRGEIHGAIWSLRHALAARAGRALAERRALREAEALAAAGKGSEAIARLEPSVPRSTRGGADPAQAVRRQVQARFARQTGQPAAEVARLEARAAEAGLDVARHTATAAGRARLSSSLGGVAMLVGAWQVAGGLAAGARAAAGANAEPAVVAALAGNEAVAFDAAGDAARAAAAREVEAAAAAAARAVEQAAAGEEEPAGVSGAGPSGPAAPTTAAGVPDAAEPAPLPAVEVTGEWPAMNRPFIEDDRSLDPAQRLALARAWAARVAEGEPDRIDRVERFGRLLAAVERARLEGAPAAQVAEARAAVLAAMRVMFPLPAGLNDATLTRRWVSLPGGVFEMGSQEDEPGSDDDETQHPVRLAPFTLGEAEVTAGQFRRLVPEHLPDDAAGLPAREVSWYAATAYAAWVGARLPTEAEWEFGSRWRGAGRALATTRYCVGDTEADLDRVGWYGGNSGSRPQPVKQKADCGGLYDMHGNVSEWVVDWYGRYAVPADGAPLSGPSGPPTGVDRVVRGGAFVDVAVLARSAWRYGTRPRYGSVWIGFRLARPAPSPGLDP